VSGIGILGQIPGTPLFGANISTTSDTEVELTWPMYLALGLAFKPMENLTLTADVQYTNWKKIDVMELMFTDQLWQVIMTQDGGNLFPLHWKNATQIRFGAEYVLNDNFALRGGYYFDPGPAPDETMNVLLPSFDFNVITFGVGYSMNGLSLGFAMEYIMGADRNIAFDPSGEQDSMPGMYTMKIFSPSISIGYTWGNK
jgi:long-chain fatty acid transport protein